MCILNKFKILIAFGTFQYYLGVNLNTGIQKYSFVVKVYHMDDEAGSNFYLNACQ